MRLEESTEDQAFRATIRAYFAELMTPAARAAEPGDATYREVLRTLGSDGWLGASWPVEFGGLGLPITQQMTFFDEASRADVPLPAFGLLTVGPTLMRHGTPDQQATYLPRLLSGEIEFSIGYTEPGAGTDLASLTTRAVRDGDTYVVNGTKAFTSGGMIADFIWLACRTDPEAPKHKGISVLIVSTDSPGFRVVPMATMTTRHTTMTYYDDVRVPAANLVGAEHGGWRVMTDQLNHERFVVANVGPVARHVDEVVAWARTTKLADGRRVIDQDWVRLHLARIAAKAEYLRLAIAHGIWSAERGDPAVVEASTCKVASTEYYKEAYRLLLEVVGAEGALRPGSPGVLLAGELEAAYRTVFLFSFSGGANEIQRDLIAEHGLGMPRAGR